jgi:glutathione S-transferase
MITVWGRRSSINVQKVLWALAETGTPFERVTVGGQFGGTGSDDYKAMNPNGLVPAIKDGDLTMFESNAILRYVTERYGAETIKPRDAASYGRAEQWIEWTATTLAPPVGLTFMNLVRTAPEKRDMKAVSNAIDQAAKNFALADKVLGNSRFLAGDRFSHGDIPLGAFWWRYQNVEIKRPAFANLDRWFAELKTRPAYQEWIMVQFGRNPAEWAENEKRLG